MTRKKAAEEVAIDFKISFERIIRLLVTYEALHEKEKPTTGKSMGSGRKSSDKADILRASVVLLHAALEDVFRTLLLHIVPFGDASVLKAVPLAGTGKTRPDKFSLAELAEFRGKSVEEVITSSVADWLQKSNYSDNREIANAIEQLGINPEPVRKFFPTLQEMMERRHWIVHRGDKNLTIGSGKHRFRSLRKDTVHHWAVTTNNFVHDLLELVYLSV